LFFIAPQKNDSKRRISRRAKGAATEIHGDKNTRRRGCSFVQSRFGGYFYCSAIKNDSKRRISRRAKGAATEIHGGKKYPPSGCSLVQQYTAVKNTRRRGCPFIQPRFGGYFYCSAIKIRFKTPNFSPREGRGNRNTRRQKIPAVGGVLLFSLDLAGIFIAFVH
jgi:hypothetical protein